MKLSLQWLSSFVDLSGLSEEEIIDRTIKAGFEVEEITRLGQGTNLVVGKVLECVPHPDSDHLHVTKTDIGTEVLDIVCGAPNCREGLKVIVATNGAELPGGIIKKSKIRGVESNGMLCSLYELGVPKELLDADSPSQNGIEELPDSFEVGETGILEKLGYKDTILDLSIYANRPDCLSMFGMAKEMAAILDRPCRLPKFSGAAKEGGPTSLKVASHTENCPHYMAKVVNHVVLKESPAWMKAHLRANGVKSINNVVDISNYVMLETGQPLHFFDLRSNPQRDITVVDDYEGDYTALDGITYAMQKGDILITSAGEPVAIGGIMGGDGSKILEDTTSILIESALFDHAQIRRTANRLGLQTEAAMRFAKGLEPLAQEKAMDRAVQLLKEYADADGLEETVAAGSSNYEPHQVKETLAHLNALIGKEYTLEQAMEVFRRLDFRPHLEGEEIVCEIPSWRSMDIKLREDLDEEVVRLTDFDDLQSTLPDLPTTIGRLTPAQQLRRLIRDDLINKGLYETVSYTLTDEKNTHESLYPLGEAVKLASPLSDARKYIRTSLMNSMLESLSYNVTHGNDDANLFEISVVYAEGKQQERLGILLHGDLSASRIRHEGLKADYYVLKGILYDLFDRIGYNASRIRLEENTLDHKHMHPYRSAVLKLGNEVLAVFGQIHPAYAAERKLSDVYYAEVILDTLLSNKPASVKAPVLNRFPSISRDMSIVVDKDVNADDLLKSVKKSGGALVVSTEVFDVYEGSFLPEGKKSVSLSIVFESKERTLKVEDVNPLTEKILQDLIKKYGASLRS